MLSLRTSEGVNLMHLLALTKAAAAAAAARIQDPAARAAEVQNAVRILLQPSATMEELLRCSAAVADCQTAEYSAATSADAGVMTGATTVATSDGNGVLLLLRQVLPAVLSGAADYLRRPEVAEIRVYVHPNPQLSSQGPNSPSDSIIHQPFGAACAALYKELREEVADLLKTETEGQWRLRILASESPTAVAAKAMRLLHMLNRHRCSANISISCRLVLHAPDGLMLSDAVSRDIFVHLDGICKPIEALLQEET